MADLVRITKSLATAVSALSFAGEVTHVYNPLDYAWAPHRNYLTRYGASPKEVVLVGMNPGPFGMAQTGVPFGEVGLARDWLEVEARVGRPPVEHEKRPIEGFACERSEVSGRRLWGWAKERFGSAERFFSRFFVHNYCPLVFMAESGRNITPDKLPAQEREPLFDACDRALIEVVESLAPTWVIGVGTFAETRARKALGDDMRIARLLHPSPASPAANRGWSDAADATFAELGIEIPPSEQ